LLDIGLPEMDGYCLAGHIRQLSDRVGLKLIALTGYGQADDVNRARAAGFDEHLVKPLDFALLRRTLERFGRHSGP
jgi:CheY-like chemotaxis protein